MISCASCRLCASSSAAAEDAPAPAAARRACSDEEADSAAAAAAPAAARAPDRAGCGAAADRTRRYCAARVSSRAKIAASGSACEPEKQARQIQLHVIVLHVVRQEQRRPSLHLSEVFLRQLRHLQATACQPFLLCYYLTAQQNQVMLHCMKYAMRHAPSICVVQALEGCYASLCCTALSDCVVQKLEEGCMASVRCNISLYAQVGGETAHRARVRTRVRAARRRRRRRAQQMRGARIACAARHAEQRHVKSHPGRAGRGSQAFHECSGARPCEATAPGSVG